MIQRPPRYAAAPLRYFRGRSTLFHEVQTNGGWPVLHAAPSPPSQLIDDPAAGVSSVDASALTLKWDLNAEASATRTLVWDLRSEASATRTLLWDLRTEASATRTLKWDLNAEASQSRSLVWDLRAEANASRTLIWDLRTEASATRTLIWDLRNDVAKSLTIVWDLAAQIPDPVDAPTLSLLWDVRGEVDRPLYLSWGLEVPPVTLTMTRADVRFEPIRLVFLWRHDSSWEQPVARERAPLPDAEAPIQDVGDGSFKAEFKDIAPGLYVAALSRGIITSEIEMSGNAQVVTDEQATYYMRKRVDLLLDRRLRSPVHWSGKQPGSF